MAKRSSVGSNLSGLVAIATALSALRGGRVDVGFFAGNAARTAEAPRKAAARSARNAKYTGAGEKAGYFKPGVELAKRRAALKKAGGEEVLTNPEIAAKNEFGVGVPRRSMLRMPMHLHGDKVVKGAKDEATAALRNAPKDPRATAKRILDRMGIAAEGVVQDAFSSRGFGSWKPNAPATIALKGSDSPLIDEGQLARAVDSRAVL